MPNIRLVLSYDGTDFHGWQTQPNYRTVQQALEDALHAVTGERLHANASGRTDTGVHAAGQVVNFHTASTLAPDVLVRALNAHLPHDVVARSADVVPQSFDANRDAKRHHHNPSPPRRVTHAAPAPSPSRPISPPPHAPPPAAPASPPPPPPRRARPPSHTFDPACPNRLSSVRTITHLGVNRFADWI